jgi:hypothetical protein
VLRWTAVLESLLLASCAGLASTEPGWKRIDLEPFSMELPGDLKSVPVRPIDSYVEKFASPTLKVSFD